MASKEWLYQFGDHEIRVINTWLNGAYLYIDGFLRDTSHSRLAIRPQTFMSARLKRDDPSSPLIEVKAEALFFVKVQICADGKRIAGDHF